MRFTGTIKKNLKNRLGFFSTDSILPSSPENLNASTLVPLSASAEEEILPDYKIINE